jgi:hypothetical protein
MNSIGILKDVSEAELNIAIEAIKAERARVSRKQVLKIANKKLEDLEEFCTRHCILIVTPELEGGYHPIYKNLSGKIKLK